MYDMTTFKKRFFSIKLSNGKVLDIEPPKMKVLKKIFQLSKVKDSENMGDNDIDNLTQALSMALSKNKQEYKVNENWIDENFNIDEIQDLLQEYFGWVNTATKN